MSRTRPVSALGHPLHPPLTHVPFALLLVTPLWDVGALLFQAELARVAYWCSLLGLIAAGPAVVVGVVDLLRIGSDDRAMNTALVHAGCAVTMVSLFLVAFALRPSPKVVSPLSVIALELIGLCVLGATGWFGGHLVYHYGVGVRAQD